MHLLARRRLVLSLSLGWFGVCWVVGFGFGFEINCGFDTAWWWVDSKFISMWQINFGMQPSVLKIFFVWLCCVESVRKGEGRPREGAWTPGI
jgi:hypothetical protein